LNPRTSLRRSAVFQGGGRVAQRRGLCPCGPVWGPATLSARGAEMFASQTGARLHSFVASPSDGENEVNAGAGPARKEEGAGLASAWPQKAVRGPPQQERVWCKVSGRNQYPRSLMSISRIGQAVAPAASHDDQLGHSSRPLSARHPRPPSTARDHGRARARQRQPRRRPGANTAHRRGWGRSGLGRRRVGWDVSS
jgi:hypothetical protein